MLLNNMSFNLDYLHPKLKKCNKCKTYNVTVEQHASITGCIIVTCVECFTSWLACPICQKPKRFSMGNLHRVTNHFNNKLLHPELSPIVANEQISEVESNCDDVSIASVSNHSHLSNNSDSAFFNLDQSVDDNSVSEPESK